MTNQNKQRSYFTRKGWHRYTNNDFVPCRGCSAKSEEECYQRDINECSDLNNWSDEEEEWDTDYEF